MVRKIARDPALVAFQAELKRIADAAKQQREPLEAAYVEARAAIAAEEKAARVRAKATYLATCGLPRKHEGAGR